MSSYIIWQHLLLFASKNIFSNVCQFRGGGFKEIELSRLSLNKQDLVWPQPPIVDSESTIGRLTHSWFHRAWWNTWGYLAKLTLSGVAGLAKSIFWLKHPPVSVTLAFKTKLNQLEIFQKWKPPPAYIIFLHEAIFQEFLKAVYWGSWRLRNEQKKLAGLGKKGRYLIKHQLWRLFIVLLVI